MFQLIKRLTPLLFLLLLPLGSRAQVSREAVIARVAEANKADGTLSFSFTRIRKTAMAAKDLVSEGKMVYGGTDRLRWEITGPVKSLFILNGQRVLSENARGRRITDLSTDRRFQGIARNIAHAAAGSPINERDFRIEVLTSDKEWVLKMTPLRRELSGLFQEIVLTADSATGLARRIVLRDLGGDTTTLQLRDIVKGGTVAPENFAF